jgi:hypothetical protein
MLCPDAELSSQAACPQFSKSSLGRLTHLSFPSLYPLYLRKTPGGRRLTVLTVCGSGSLHGLKGGIGVSRPTPALPSALGSSTHPKSSAHPKKARSRPKRYPNTIFTSRCAIAVVESGGLYFWNRGTAGEAGAEMAAVAGLRTSRGTNARDRRLLKLPVGVAAAAKMCVMPLVVADVGVAA